MARPLRIEYPGAVYHVTSRGNEKKPVFKDDTDRPEIKSIFTLLDSMGLKLTIEPSKRTARSSKIKKAA